MKNVMMKVLVLMVFDYLYVSEIYNDILDIIVVEYISNNHVELIQFHLDLKTEDIRRGKKTFGFLYQQRFHRE
jgi:hypothetical protein